MFSCVNENLATVCLLIADSAHVRLQFPHANRVEFSIEFSILMAIDLLNTIFFRMCYPFVCMNIDNTWNIGSDNSISRLHKCFNWSWFCIEIICLLANLFVLCPCLRYFFFFFFFINKEMFRVRVKIVELTICKEENQSPHHWFRRIDGFDYWSSFTHSRLTAITFVKFGNVLCWTSYTDKKVSIDIGRSTFYNYMFYQHGKNLSSIQLSCCYRI